MSPKVLVTYVVIDIYLFINWAKMSNNIDQYAKVKLGGGNEFMDP